MQEQLPRVLSVPFPLRFLFANDPAAMTAALGIVYRTIGTHLVHKAGFTKTNAQSKVAKSSHYKPFLTLNQTTRAQTPLVKRPDFHYMPV